MNSRLLISTPILTLALLPTFHALGDEFSYPGFKPTQTDFGGVGLIQMPSGRMAEEGEFSFSATYNDEYQHFNFSLQLFPWLETTVRYTRVPDVLFSDDPSFSGDNKYTDKGIDFKIRLLKESFWLPETSIGVRDIGGTGLFDGEFIAANKHFDPFDFTLGVGWGYIGNSGNLSGDKARGADCGRADHTGTGGNVDFERWFSGCAAIFGGLEYQTPLPPLSLKLEYDGNDYLSDFPVSQAGIDMSQSSKINLGAIYHFGNWGNLRLSYERGTTWTLGFTLRTNFNTLRPLGRDEPRLDYQPQAAGNVMSDEDWQAVSDQLYSIAGYKNASIYANDQRITVLANQRKYRDSKVAAGRAATILADLAPAVSQYSFIQTSSQQPIAEIRIDAAQFARFANNRYLGAELEDSISVTNPSEPQGQLVVFPDRTWDYGLSPVWRQSIGGSESFYLFNIGINAGASYWFSNHFEFSGSVYINIYDTYDKFLYEVPPDGTDLKRVRTLIRQYINEKRLRVDNLQLTWMDKPGDNWYAQAYGGYLETMFAGVGSEVLYRTLGSHWALGLDVNYVVQRDPESQFGLFSEEFQFDPLTNSPYRVQTGTFTGHISAYYQTQWEWLPNALIKFSAGQFLADDEGFSVDFSKQFTSGVIAGAYAAKTDLSAEEFGEGSFTKGLYISIPFDLMTVKPSRSRAIIAWAPLTRDGGQTLRRKYHLYSTSDAMSPWYNRAIAE